MLKKADEGIQVRTPKELLLASKEFAIENRGVSWWCLLSTIALFIGLHVIMFLPIPFAIRLVASVVTGLTHVRLFILYHDFQHGTILRNSKIASAIMYSYGLIALNPQSIWKRSHDYHHRNNSKALGASIGSYPLMSTEAYAEAPFFQKMLYRMTRHPLTIGCGYVTIFLIGMCLRPFLFRPKEHFDAGLSMVVHFALAALLIVIDPWLFVIVMLIPNTIASMLGSYLFYAQHNFPSVRIRERADWNYVDAALNSSSYMKMGKIMQWFTGNIGYHHVHHLNARIPFYRLPEAMEKLEELQSPGTTSLHPRDVVNCFRLKLWDREKGQLVTFRGETIDDPMLLN